MEVEGSHLSPEAEADHHLPEVDEEQPGVVRTTPKVSIVLFLVDCPRHTRKSTHILFKATEGALFLNNIFLDAISIFGAQIL